MFTKHITHVVLYAKNFYRHTDDVIADMQRFMQLDGHKYAKIKTAEKVVEAMTKDYLKWVDSIEESEQIDKDRRRANAGDSVNWQDGPAGKVWNILNAYSTFIPMTSAVIGYPSYDKYHMPQFNIIERLFSKGMSFVEMNKAAKSFLDISQVEDYDKHMNELLEKYHFADVAKYFGVGVNELEDEMWNGYEQFMDEHMINDKELEQGHFHVETEHFILYFHTNRYAVDINAECKFDCVSVQCTADTVDEGLIKVFDAMDGKEDDLKKMCDIAQSVNEKLGKTVFYDHACLKIFVLSDKKDDMETFRKYNLPEIKAGTKKEPCSWSSGGHIRTFTYDIDKGVYGLSVTLAGLFECVAKDSSLRTFGGCIAGAKY